MEHKVKKAVIKPSNLQPEFVELLHPGYSINHTATLNTNNNISVMIIIAGASLSEQHTD